MPDSNVIIIAIQCHYCPRQVHPAEVVRIGDDVIMCWQCYVDRHTVAVEAFNPPHECAECRRTFDEIAHDTIGHQVKMYPHLIDREYKILCARCDEAYVQKQKQMFRPTAFGYHERKV